MGRGSGAGNNPEPLSRLSLNTAAPLQPLTCSHALLAIWDISSFIARTNTGAAEIRMCFGMPHPRVLTRYLWWVTGTNLMTASLFPLDAASGMPGASHHKGFTALWNVTATGKSEHRESPKVKSPPLAALKSPKTPVLPTAAIELPSPFGAEVS